MRIICLPVSGGLPPDPISTTSNDQTSRQDYVNLIINCICVFVFVSVHLASRRSGGFDDTICSQSLCQLDHQRNLYICFFLVYFLYLSFCFCTCQHRAPALMVIPLGHMGLEGRARFKTRLLGSVDRSMS